MREIGEVPLHVTDRTIVPSKRTIDRAILDATVRLMSDTQGGCVALDISEIRFALGSLIRRSAVPNGRHSCCQSKPPPTWRGCHPPER